MFRKGIFFFIICMFVVGFFCYYYNRWKYLWAVAVPEQHYSVLKVQDDTLRVLMIGDSWAGIHSELNMDSFLSSKLEQRVQCPVKVVSKGKGGEKSRGIYQLMFQLGGYGTKHLLLTGTDYCIVLAGINDAAANLGTKQFCAHYRMILDFLLSNDIRPVVVEIPDVDIWTIYGDKPKKDLLVDYMKSIMVGCGMYNYHEYRDALFAMLQEEHLLEQVVYIPVNGWNGEGVKLNPSLFIEDKIHLNREGYMKLDICIATAIANDLQQSQNSTLVNHPVGKDTQ